MIDRNLESLAKVGFALRRMTASTRPPLTTRNGFTIGLHTIDSRTSAWLRVKEGILDKCSKGRVRLLACWRKLSISSTYCDHCVESTYGCIYETLDGKFGRCKTGGKNLDYYLYEPVAGVVSCIGDFLSDPRNAALFSRNCPFGHSFTLGDYVTTVEYEFHDAAFEVDYFINSFVDNNTTNP